MKKIFKEHKSIYPLQDSNDSHNRHPQACSYHNTQPVLDERALSKFNTDPTIIQRHADIVPPLDNTKIYAWMEKNEKYEHEVSYPDPAPSPALRRKKQPIVYDNSRPPQGVQPIAQDLGMPLLPQPDTGTVLVEVKRVLEEPKQQRASSRVSTAKSTSR